MRISIPFAAITLVLFLFAFPLSSPAAPWSAGMKSYGTILSFLSSQNDFFTNVTITGKVKTPEGRPIKGAWIVLKDADTNAVIRATLTSSFGFYRLEQIESGRLYVLSVTHRRYLFALPAQLMEINEDRSGVDFTGEANN